MMFERILLKLQVMFIPCEANNSKPKLLESNFLFYLLVGLIILKLAVLFFLYDFPKNIFFADVSKTILIELTNKQRENLDLDTLQESPQLNQAALFKAQDMFSHGYFSHDNPQGTTPWYWFQQAGYDYQFAGENLGIGFLDSEEIYQAWNDSPSHQANLLNPLYKEIGIAILQGDFKGAETTVVVQLFGSPRKQEEQDLSKDTIELQGKLQSVSNLSDRTNLKQVSGVQPTSIQFNLLKFMTKDYNDLLQEITFYLLVFVSLFLLINIFVRLSVQHRGLNLRILALVCLLALCVLVNKDVMLLFIPHTLNIY